MQSLNNQIYRVDPYKTSYLAFHHDTFLHFKFIVIPCFVMTIITDIFISPLSMLKILWIFSIYIEAIAILPQLVQLYRYKETENLSMLYVFFLGIYRGLFVLNWYCHML